MNPEYWGRGDGDPHLWSLRPNGNIQTRGQSGQPGQADLYSDQTPSYEKLSRTGTGPHRIPSSFKIITHTNILEIRDRESVQRRTKYKNIWTVLSPGSRDPNCVVCCL